MLMNCCFPLFLLQNPKPHKLLHYPSSSTHRMQAQLSWAVPCRAGNDLDQAGREARYWLNKIILFCRSIHRFSIAISSPTCLVYFLRSSSATIRMVWTPFCWDLQGRVKERRYGHLIVSDYFTGLLQFNSIFFNVACCFTDAVSSYSTVLALHCLLWLNGARRGLWCV